MAPLAWLFPSCVRRPPNSLRWMAVWALFTRFVVTQYCKHEHEDHDNQRQNLKVRHNHHPAFVKKEGKSQAPSVSFLPAARRPGRRFYYIMKTPQTQELAAPRAPRCTESTPAEEIVDRAPAQLDHVSPARRLRLAPLPFPLAACSGLQHRQVSLQRHPVDCIHRNPARHQPRVQSQQELLCRQFAGVAAFVAGVAGSGKFTILSCT